jgi:hypothetical protein
MANISSSRRHSRHLAYGGTIRYYGDRRTPPTIEPQYFKFKKISLYAALELQRHKMIRTPFLINQCCGRLLPETYIFNVSIHILDLVRPSVLQEYTPKSDQYENVKMAATGLRKLLNFSANTILVRNRIQVRNIVTTETGSILEAPQKKEYWDLLEWQLQLPQE